MLRHGVLCNPEWRVPWHGLPLELIDWCGRGWRACRFRARLCNQLILIVGGFRIMDKFGRLIVLQSISNFS